MRCPQCVESGERSCVYPRETTSTLRMHGRFYDEDGVFHHHDPNWTSTEFSCSHGHRWATRWRAACPAGDYPAAKETTTLAPREPVEVSTLDVFGHSLVAEVKS